MNEFTHLFLTYRASLRGWIGGAGNLAHIGRLVDRKLVRGNVVVVGTPAAARFGTIREVVKVRLATAAKAVIEAWRQHYKQAAALVIGILRIRGLRPAQTGAAACCIIQVVRIWGVNQCKGLNVKRLR